MKVVVSVTHGTDDPTQATLGVLAAKAAADQGHDVTLWLQGEGAVLANKHVYPHVQGVNMPAMKDAVEALVDKGVPFWVCKACGAARGVTEDNWVSTASYQGMGDFVGAALAADKNIDF
ncbi:sulfur reduction protein DsrE [Thiohalorhabdus denitrificans]|uniref:DsrE/DsrF-like family protein n=1 Tax=Thiohalorhabdus denitrificans TaxID=381306 RepID=A0A0P9C3W9_9GAMM|nr:DsrE family protein [Thiohalorhabdus denitrificans]KPV39678.1 sulfur reduction protein DsrE [Thiohalorhabdus denitrificans]SCX94349.1 DsrE/DsrF-like family protein [Thiohalorhabdus denitrificans]